MLDSKEIDAVLIATPHYDHPVIAIEALNRDLHTLVEKPATKDLYWSAYALSPSSPLSVFIMSWTSSNSKSFNESNITKCGSIVKKPSYPFLIASVKISTAVCDVNPEKKEWALEKLPKDVKFFDNYIDMLDSKEFFDIADLFFGWTSYQMLSVA